jgi:hypothetical protein
VKAAIGVFVVLVIGGCATAQPIRDVVDAPALAASGRTLSRAQIARAIERGARALGWQVFAEGPGAFTGRLELRSHVAIVGIEHDTATYSIRYRESVNLHASDGTIHEAYNRWVQSLHRAIRDELRAL